MLFMSPFQDTKTHILLRKKKKNMPPNDPGFQHGIRGTVITPLVTLFFSCVYKLMLRSQATKTFIVGWFESQPYKWWWLGDGESSCSTNIIFHRSWIDDHPLVWENIHHLLPMASIDIHGTLMLPISSYLHLAANLTTMCPSPAAPLALLQVPCLARQPAAQRRQPRCGSLHKAAGHLEILYEKYGK